MRKMKWMQMIITQTYLIISFPAQTEQQIREQERY